MKNESNLMIKKQFIVPRQTSTAHANTRPNRIRPSLVEPDPSRPQVREDPNLRLSGYIYGNGQIDGSERLRKLTLQQARAQSQIETR